MNCITYRNHFKNGYHGVKGDIFEKVADEETITWCPPLVVQPKSKFTEMKNEGLGQALTWEFQISPWSKAGASNHQDRPHDCEIFPKLDLRQGHHQLALDPSSGQVAAFSTPWRNYRSQRLVFGAKSPQDVFQEAMFRIFGDTHHCVNQRDDTPLGQNGPDRTYRSAEDRPKESERSRNQL